MKIQLTIALVLCTFIPLNGCGGGSGSSEVPSDDTSTKFVRMSSQSIRLNESIQPDLSTYNYVILNSENLVNYRPSIQGQDFFKSFFDFPLYSTDLSYQIDFYRSNSISDSDSIAAPASRTTVTDALYKINRVDMRPKLEFLIDFTQKVSDSCSSILTKSGFMSYRIDKSPESACDFTITFSPESINLHRGSNLKVVLYNICDLQAPTVELGQVLLSDTTNSVNYSVSLSVLDNPSCYYVELFKGSRVLDFRGYGTFSLPTPSR